MCFLKAKTLKVVCCITLLNKIKIRKWRGIVVSMMACGSDDLSLIPRLTKVHNDVIFFLGVFMIQFNLILI